MGTMQYEVTCEVESWNNGYERNFSCQTANVSVRCRHRVWDFGCGQGEASPPEGGGVDCAKLARRTLVESYSRVRAVSSTFARGRQYRMASPYIKQKMLKTCLWANTSDDLPTLEPYKR